MAIFDETPFVERISFFNGQPLFADDLHGLDAFDREMRWLHNRSLHQPGIGNGFAVSGVPGDSEVWIQPGYAVDALGREIVLLERLAELVPPVASEPDGQSVLFDLTVSYPSDEDLEEAETRKGACRPQGAMRLRERPIVCWVRLRRDAGGEVRPVDPAHAVAVRAGMKLVLARVEVFSCKLKQALVTSGRRNARAPRQPFLAAGHSVVRWEPWTPVGIEIGVKARVDTGAVFRTTPSYQVRIEGIRPLVLGEAGEPIFLIDLPVYIQDAGPTGFTCLSAVFPILGGTPDPKEVLAQANAQWSVTWLGIED